MRKTQWVAILLWHTPFQTGAQPPFGWLISRFFMSIADFWTISLSTIFECGKLLSTCVDTVCKAVYRNRRQTARKTFFVNNDATLWEFVMAKEFWTVTEVLEFFEVDEQFLKVLEEEEIVCATCEDDNLPARKFSAVEMEKLRVARMLMKELEVNLPGVEIILRMRRNMIDMRNQFDAILGDLSRQVRIHLNTGR